MRSLNVLGPTLKRLRGYDSVPEEHRDLVASIETSQTIPSEATLEALAVALGLELPARHELQRARVETASWARARGRVG